jgi:hypothetical protein
MITMPTDYGKIAIEFTRKSLNSYAMKRFVGRFFFLALHNLSMVMGL